MIKRLSYWLAVIFLAWIGSTQASMPAVERGYKVVNDLAALASALEQFHHDKGRYPTTDEGLNALVADHCIMHVPKDPWGNPYQYLQPALRSGKGYDLWSYGADGQPGGTGMNADVGNWPGSIESYRDMVSRSMWWSEHLIGLAAGGVSGLVLGLPFYLVGILIRHWRGRNSIGAAVGASLQLAAGLIAVVTLVLVTLVAPAFVD